MKANKRTPSHTIQLIISIKGNFSGLSGLSCLYIIKIDIK